MADATTDAGSWFRGLGGASQGGSGNWFRAGVYECELVSLSRQVSKDPGKKGARQIIGEFRVVRVISRLPADGEYAASQEVGEVASVYINLDSAYPSLDMGKLKGIIDAAHGPPEDGTTEAAWMTLAAKVTEPPGTVLAGARIIVTAGKTTTRKNAKIVTTTFAAAPADSAAA